MENTLNSAFTLMAVGMITVFIILMLVVVMGGGLIRIVNRFFPEPVRKRGTAAAQEAGISPNKMAAIVAAVEIFTKGKGKVSHIEQE